MHALTLIPLLLLLGWLLGVAGLLGLLVLLVVLTFITAAFHASPRPAELRIGILTRVGCWLGEIASGLIIVLLTMPLERLIMRRDVAARRDDGWPMLLIHGYINNAGSAWTLHNELVQRGFGVHTLNLEPTYTDIDNYAPRIEARVRDVLARTGADKLVLIGHSMGGLALRAYLRRVPDAPVAQLITLGSPHHGTEGARVAAGRNGRQMLRGSAWLGQLAADEAKRTPMWPCPVLSIFTYDDNIVFPQESSILPGARSLPLAGIGHMSLPMSRNVSRLIAGEILLKPTRSAG
jgi:triacylglycerol esterase/lipase EstA (alpha/beta hydrolase family)